ncbi:hypothetical protein [Alkaliphilus serpentinus]|uniref:N-acetyltransferase domain-containing protein n=1 Tax=Alkaliphilus serpentinus TaxID=1482731 RepID=A0A833M7Q1_9FIRM|nr:hypothetical protein [Alkaliphilus serpentinus]KAB3531103.1 hypothetical protein F8153_05565 [Alkaliphilus serpentinus]
MFTIVDNQDKNMKFKRLFVKAEEEFISMLPFEKKPFHDFERYITNTSNEKHFFHSSFMAIDEMDEDYCLYHFYYLNEGDDTLRTTLILPSNWDRRFEILEKSIKNLKEWLKNQDHIKRLLVQSLEMGKVEYYPTLSHYIIPVLIKAGFNPDYRMYMKWREGTLSVNSTLPEGFSVTGYDEKMKKEIIEFYTTNTFEGYFSTMVGEELLQQFSEEAFRRTARFILDKEQKIVGGLFAVLDSSEDVMVGNKIWFEDLAILKEYNDLGLDSYLVSKVLRAVTEKYPNVDTYTYASRKAKKTVKAFKSNNFNGFEFWVDMVFNK